MIAEAPTREVDARVRRAWLLIAALSARRRADRGRRSRRCRRAGSRGRWRRSRAARAQLGDGDFSIARRALRRAGDRRDRPGARLERRPDRRARRARARVLGQRLAPAADAADRAAPAPRGGRRRATTREARRASSRRRCARPTGSRRRSPTCSRHARQASAGSDRRPQRRERGARARGALAAGLRARAAARSRSAPSKNVLVRGLARDGRARSSTCCSTTRCATAAARCASTVRRGRPRGADHGRPTAGRACAPEDRERIFERGASQSGGTGIGLHLARTLARADSGGLRVLDGRAAALRAAAAAARGVSRGAGA